MAYLTLAQFRARTTMASSYVDELEAREPGWIDTQLGIYSGAIDSRLRKRYEAPFAAPYPDQVLIWLTQIVTVEAWFKRGVDSTDSQWAEIKQAAVDAKAEIKEAADAQNGLYDLPLRGGSDSAISKGAPLGYSEQSPYVWTDQQACAGRNEDANGRGTGG